MSTHVTVIDPLDINGDLSCPVGTRLWCIAAKVRIQELLERHETSHESIEALISQVVETSAWKQLTKRDGKPFASYTEFCTTRKPHGLGRSDEEIKKIIADGKAKNAQDLAAAARLQAETVVQGKHRSSLHGNDDATQGNSGEYLLRRLARLGGDWIDRYEAGEFSSVRQAAIAAGIVKVPTPLHQAQKAFVRLKHEDQLAFFAWLTTQMTTEPSV